MANGGPFWNAAYSDDSADAFGKPSDEIIRLGRQLPAGARVLDVGCGEGRNALHLAKCGLDVEAFDHSHAGVDKLRRRAADKGLRVSASVDDAATFAFVGPYDLIVSHGMLHLLERAAWERVIERMQRATASGGVNVVCVFTDREPVPDDLAPFVKGLFREGELFERYAGWKHEEALSYVFDDEHPGGVRHRHAADKLVAWKP